MVNQSLSREGAGGPRGTKKGGALKKMLWGKLGLFHEKGLQDKTTARP